ncbi:damage-inducible protein DinB [Pseudomonas sp. FW305-BF6]|nr:damage-inducible protein DinB [Pseudomonas sp. FW305-BF6]
MITFFEYNWQVRSEWLELCETLPKEELLKERVGGIGNILHTLLHIVDVEYSWIRCIQGKPDVEFNFDKYETVESIRDLSNELQIECKQFLQSRSSEMEYNTPVKASWSKNEYTKGEIVRHIIAHEIHHIGQLSIWARELGIQPISANLVGRNLIVHH